MLRATRTGTTLEMELDLASIGLTQGDLTNLAYMYIAVGISNPSAPQDLFANDSFSAAFGSGVEFDTLLLSPEPGTASLLGLGLVGLAWLRRRSGPLQKRDPGSVVQDLMGRPLLKHRPQDILEV